MVAQPQFDPSPIIRAMAIQGYKLESLARKLGCSTSAVCNMIRGLSTRSRYLLPACEILGVDVEACYPLTPPEKPTPKGASRK